MGLIYKIPKKTRPCNNFLDESQYIQWNYLLCIQSCCNIKQCSEPVVWLFSHLSLLCISKNYNSSNKSTIYNSNIQGMDTNHWTNTEGWKHLADESAETGVDGPLIFRIFSKDLLLNRLKILKTNKQTHRGGWPSGCCRGCQLEHSRHDSWLSQTKANRVLWLQS